ncbi:Ig-like domain-containing protein, partial [Providencia rettgeri]|uniref:Ig-like domain-containing protein n=1 Tax=Providencia rettgeri TaxID=587 RepID=UPI0023AB34B8
MNSENMTNIPVRKFKVQGLDLIITTLDGKTEVLKNGLSDIILGNIALSTEQGDTLTQDEILSSISMNVGADAVYIKEQFVSETVDIDTEDHKKQNDVDDIEKQFEDTFAKLQQKNKELVNAVRALESTNKEQTDQLSSSLTKLNQAKNELNQKTKVEKNKADVVSNELSPPPVKMPTIPASSTTSAPVGKVKDAVTSIKTHIFIQGQLDETLISGTPGSQITNIKTPTFVGKVSLDATAYLEIADTKYAITADKDGKWVLPVETPFDDGTYKYKLVASRSGDIPVTVEGEIIIDTLLADVTVGLDNNSNSGVKNDGITHHTRPTFSGNTEPNSTVTFLIAGQSLSATANAQGEWRVTVNNALPDGESTYHVTATDTAGNSQTTDGSVTVKTTLPDATAQLEGRNDFLTNKAA